MTPGQPVKVRLLDRQPRRDAVTLKDLRVKGFDGNAACEHPSSR